MKKPILILAAILMISFSASGQSGKDIPAQVKSAFSQKFPKATNVKWGRESDKEWEAEFQNDGISYSANFDNAGNWMETEYKISQNEIPAPVKATLDKEASGSKIKVSEVSETKEGKVYEFVIGKGEEKAELVIDNAGKVIRKEQLRKEDDKDEDD